MNRRQAGFAFAGLCFTVAAAAGGWLAAGVAGLLAVTVTACVLLLLRLARLRVPPVPYPGERQLAEGESDPYTRYRKLYNRVSWGQVSARQFDSSTRPALTRIAAARLMERRGIDLARDPAAAREVLGERLFTLVDPARPDATDRAARAAGLGEVTRLVQRLEEL
ncbi:hypothetical protein SRB5_38470 [Streptomyces sp. RB5]|uniref:Uncharacterized protein n=1 Tax=Streptomyces smaragdinus TaxID=2585196 RepID=A0A7K0CJQ5_9ACTN|nr:hypothetical protein [Streptomyces smaragdinus]MQY13697.1 hypothetical protein [Streptomyces smaragdinus]